MTRRPRDPAALSPEERLVEIATILATGYRRLLLSRNRKESQISLDSSGLAEPSCKPVDGEENAAAGKGVA